MRPALDTSAAAWSYASMPDARERTRCAVMAVLSLIAAGGLYFGVLAWAGFPDGHRSEYQAWAAPFQWAAVAGLLALAAGFAWLAVGRTAPARASWCFRAAVLAVIVVVLAALVGLPAIGRDVLRLEDGQGG